MQRSNLNWSKRIEEGRKRREIEYREEVTIVVEIQSLLLSAENAVVVV